MVGGDVGTTSCYHNTPTSGTCDCCYGGSMSTADLTANHTADISESYWIEYEEPVSDPLTPGWCSARGRNPDLPGVRYNGKITLKKSRREAVIVSPYKHFFFKG